MASRIHRTQLRGQLLTFKCVHIFLLRSIIISSSVQLTFNVHNSSNHLGKMAATVASSTASVYTHSQLSVPSSSSSKFLRVASPLRRSSRTTGVRCSSEPSEPASSSAVPEVKTGFSDIFSFSGPGPETINGRLAMLGFTAALVVEVATGQDLIGQIGNGGLSWFVLAALTFSAASLIPFRQGISTESKSGGLGGIFTSSAEMLNGRAAMLGLVALALTEFAKGSPLL